MEEFVGQHNRMIVAQVFELAEFLGFETRNKYRVTDANGRELAYAAEQQKGFWGFLFRQSLGHWRSFDIHFFTPARREFMVAHHPFRWFFQRLELRTMDGRMIGAIQRRWSILSKRFDVENAQGQTLMEVSSPFWRIWTFPFYRRGRQVACISKRWSGLGSELFTDRDTFSLDVSDPSLTVEERSLILAAAIYVDLLFFEHKGSGGWLNQS